MIRVPAWLPREDRFFAASVATCIAFELGGARIFAGLANPLWLGCVFTWLFCVVLGSSLAVVRHADQLAERLGEPYGTLILTLAINFIEVMSISAVMLHGDNNPTLTRDTLFAVVMIILNGMVGLSLLVGGWRHLEQHYNLQGANTYLGVIIPLVVLSLLLPNYATTEQNPVLSTGLEIFLILIGLGLYLTFLAIQTGRHRDYFTETDAPQGRPSAAGASRGTMVHAIWLVAYLIPVVFLAKQFAHPVDYLIETLRAPDAVGGIIMAALVATPEAIGAVRAALANHLQRSVNIFLGSILSTIGLTIPAMLLISHLTGRPIILRTEHGDLLMLVLTLAVSVLTFASGRTNVIQGAVHLILFAAYLMLVPTG